MKNVILVGLLLISINPIKAQVLPIETQTVQAIAIYDEIELTLHRSDSTYLALKESNVASESLDFKVDAGKLVLRIAPNARSGAKVSADLYFKNLNSIEVFGQASVITSNLITNDSLKLVLKSGSSATIDMDGKYLEALIIEGSIAVISGYAVEQKIEVRTNGTFSGFRLEGTTGSVEVYTTGKAKINIEKELSAKAISKGYIGYKGNPRFTEKKTSVGGEILPVGDE